MRRMKALPDHRSHGTAIVSARHFGRHWHASYGLGLLEHGARSSASGRGMVDAYAGDLITTNPGEVHDGRPLGGPSRRWRMVYLEPSAMASTREGDIALTRPVLKDARLLRALRLLQMRLDEWRASSDALACDESLAEVCGLLLNSHSSAVSAPEPPTDLLRVGERPADGLLAPPTLLADLAAMTSPSTYQL